MRLRWSLSPLLLSWVVGAAPTPWPQVNLATSWFPTTGRTDSPPAPADSPPLSIWSHSSPGGVNPNASDNAEGAAQKFLDEYLRLGRHDGAPIGAAELKRHDAPAFSVVSLEDSEHAKLAFKVEEVGGRFAVGVLWGCDGSLPRWEQEQSD